MDFAVGPPPNALWAGVDVGGPRKGFHVAVIDRRRLVDVRRIVAPAAVAAWLGALRPDLVAVDSPATAAPAGEKSRPDERAFRAAGICGIRYTPDHATIAGPRPNGDDFYGWIRNGCSVYEALAAAGLPTVECFPTASWTRWGGPRGERGRGAWSAAVLRALPLEGLPARLDQDRRDAIGAALTARAEAESRTQRFGDIVVPSAPAHGAIEVTQAGPAGVGFGG